MKKIFDLLSVVLITTLFFCQPAAADVGGTVDGWSEDKNETGVEGKTDGWTEEKDNPGIGAEGTVDDWTVEEEPLTGDVNNDGKINTGDMVGLVNIILSLSTENLNMDVADVNKDGCINVGDCVALTNYILYDHF